MIIWLEEIHIVKNNLLKQLLTIFEYELHFKESFLEKYPKRKQSW